MKPVKVRKINWDLLTARPEGMDFEEYREQRKAEQKMIKERTRGGFMVWPSKGILGYDKEGKVVPVENRGTLVGKVPALVFVD